MKRILVTGGKGQLGKKIKDNMSLLADSQFVFVDIEELDIANKEAITNYFQDNSFDYIINCAAYTAVDNAEEDADSAESVNTFAPAYLAEMAKVNKVKFIHISTDYVFDGHANTPYSEETKTNPVSVYGKTKLIGEEKVFETLSDSIVIRTSWLYSEYGKNFAKTILRFAKEKESLNVVFDQVGTPTYAGNLAEAILEIIKQDIFSNSWKAGLYHYSNLGVCSWFDFAIYLVKSSNLNTRVNPVLSSEFVTKATRPAYSVFDKSKIVNTYKLSIPYWTDACDEMLRNL